MINYPRISLITPSYNQGEFIEETIQSVLNQNYPNLQYIIIDGGSTDNTLEIIEKYKDFISIFISEPDNGQTDALNKGYKFVDGEIFNWLNSDDYLEEGILFKIAEEYKEKNFDGIFFDLNLVDEKSTILSRAKGTRVIKNQIELIGQLKPLIQPASFFNTRITDKVFPLNQKLQYTMDFEMWIRINLHYKNLNFVCKDEIAVNFRIHLNSKTSNHYTSDNPFDKSNKFLGEINKVMFSLSDKLVSFKKVLETLPKSNIELSYSQYLMRCSKPLLFIYVKHLADILYSSSNKNSIIESRKFVLALLKQRYYSFQISKMLILSSFPSILILIRRYRNK